MLRISLASRALLFTSLVAIPNVVCAQPDTTTPQRQWPAVANKRQPFVRVDVTVPSQGAITLNIQATDCKISDVIEQIVRRGRIQVVVGAQDNLVIDSIKMADATPLEALQSICYKFDFNCENQNGVWVVSHRKAAVLQPKALGNRIDAMEIKDVDVKEALAMIANEFKVAITVNTNVKGWIAYANLSGKSPRQAIELMASAAGLSTQEKNGTLLISNTPA